VWVKIAEIAKITHEELQNLQNTATLIGALIWYIKRFVLNGADLYIILLDTI